jgi:hypothetical protein
MSPRWRRELFFIDIFACCVPGFIESRFNSKLSVPEPDPGAK